MHDSLVSRQICQIFLLGFLQSILKDQSLSVSFFLFHRIVVIMKMSLISFPWLVSTFSCCAIAYFQEGRPLRQSSLLNIFLLIVLGPYQIIMDHSLCCDYLRRLIYKNKLTFTEYFLCVRHCFKCFSHLSLSHSIPALTYEADTVTIFILKVLEVEAQMK